MDAIAHYYMLRVTRNVLRVTHYMGHVICNVLCDMYYGYKLHITYNK